MTANTKITSVFSLGQQVQQLRKQQGLTQAQLAALSGTGTRFVGDFERGKENLNFGKMLQVLSALGLDLYVSSRMERTWLKS